MFPGLEFGLVDYIPAAHDSLQEILLLLGPVQGLLVVIELVGNFEKYFDQISHLNCEIGAFFDLKGLVLAD